jgi:hypothetical protein
MGFQHALLALLGTLICLMGFIKWPRGKFELMQPRFIVPLMIWSATFAQVFYRLLEPEPSSIYTESRDIAGMRALEYLILSMVCFWVGYVLPVGGYLARPLTRMQTSLPVSPSRLRPLGAALCVLISFLTPIFGTFVSMVSILGAALVGFSWPDRSYRNGLHVVVGCGLLLLACTPGMASFSRGTGFPFVVAYVAYAVRQRSLPLKTGIACVLIAAIAGTTGMTGRGVHGHYAGVFPYIGHFFTDGLWSWAYILDVVMGANDSFTTLCVSIRAVGAVNLGQFTPVEWFIFQIPIPRIFGIHPEWNFTLTYFVGGRGAWNYTSGMFGDTYVHFGMFGSMLFAVLGVAYRFIATLNPAQPDTVRSQGINPYLILTLTSYYATAMGLFNAFRTWVVPFFYPLYLTIAAVIILWMVRPPRHDLPLYGVEHEQYSHG